MRNVIEQLTKEKCNQTVKTINIIDQLRNEKPNITAEKRRI